MIKDPRGAGPGILSFHFQFIIMARVKFSPIVTDIAGSVGGFTFQRNKYGNTMRRKPLPINPATSAQYNIRQNIITIQKAWQDMTDAERLQWSRFPDYSMQSIKNNKSVKLSGHGLYLKWQSLRLLAGLSIKDSVAYVPISAVPAIDEITLGPSAFNLTFASNVSHLEYFFIFSITTPRNPNQAYSATGLRQMQVAYAAGTDFNLIIPYLAAFGIVGSAPFYVHTRIQWFSVEAPIFLSPIISVYQVTIP